MEIHKELFRKICREKERDIHGRFLQQFDNLEKSKNDLSDKQKLGIIKQFGLDMIHEEIRNLRNTVIFASEGREFQKYNIYKPDCK